ncbi:MAG: carboxypeptidase regulatory-like domain-containing protein [Acidobacteriaceae bacterium]
MNWKKLWLTVAIAALVMAVVPGMAQTAASGAAPTQTGSIHGYVNDPTGAAITNGIISLIPEGDTAAKYTFHTDANGNYKGSGIKAGTYIVTLREPNTPKGQVIDQFNSVKILGGQDTLQNFDLSRPEYIKKLSPEQQKQLAKVREENAKILKQNAVIKNLNKDLEAARKDNADKNYAAADALMTKDTSAMPDAYLLWVELGKAQLGEKKFNNAITSLTKAISLNQASKKPNLEVSGIAGNALGEAYADAGHFQKSDAAYIAAAQADPKNAFMYYQNEAIVMNRSGQNDLTVKAADAAIAANPNEPIPYYLKGQALIQKATVDPKTQKIIAPAGCVEAYQKYLQLAPDGPFANDVKGVLQSLGQKIQSSVRNRGH